MVTEIQADPEVAFRKLQSKELFMFYLFIYLFLRANYAKRHYKLYFSHQDYTFKTIMFVFWVAKLYTVYKIMNFIHLLLSHFVTVMCHLYRTSYSLQNYHNFLRWHRNVIVISKRSKGLLMCFSRLASRGRTLN